MRFVVVFDRADMRLVGDETSYDSIAKNLASGNGYYRVDSLGHMILSATRGSSYVLFLTLMYLVAGHNVMVVLLAQVLLDVASCFLVFKLTHVLFRRVDAAALAAALYALYPQIVFGVSHVLTETFTILFMLLALYQYARYAVLGRRNGLYWSAVGVGIAGLSKPVLLMLPLLFLVADCGNVRLRDAVRRLAVQAAIIGAMMTPWVIRNAVAFHAFIPTVTNGAFTLWCGAGPANGRIIVGVGPRGSEYATEATKGIDEVEAARWYSRDSIRIIREDPAHYARMLLMKPPRLWFNLPYYAPPTPRNHFFVAVNTLIAFLAVLGILVRKPARTMVRLLVLLVVYYTLVHMIYFSSFRYSLPVYAFMFCFAGGGAVSILDRLLPRSLTQRWSADGKAGAD